MIIATLLKRFTMLFVFFCFIGIGSTLGQESNKEINRKEESRSLENSARYQMKVESAKTNEGSDTTRKSNTNLQRKSLVLSKQNQPLQINSQNTPSVKNKHVVLNKQTVVLQKELQSRIVKKTTGKNDH